MKKILLFFTLLGFMSCSDSNNPEQIKKKIQDYRQTISNLQQNIQELEAKLPENNLVQKALNIKVEKLVENEFEHFFEANGEIEAVEDAIVTPEANGRIKTVHVKEGQFVAKGELLISLNAQVLQNSIAELETGLELTTALYEKQKNLWEQKVGSEVQYLQAKNSKESLEKKLSTLKSQYAMTKVYAPFSGVVDEIYQKQGEMASPAAPLLHLINLNELYVNTEVSESYIARIRKGDQVKVEFTAFPEMSTNSEIYRVGNTINTSNRSFKVQIKLKNQQKKLKPNMLATVKMRDFYKENAITVPSLLIKKDAMGYFIFVVENDNDVKLAKKQYLKVGMSANERTIVTEGLNEGTFIITEGYNLVANGTQVEY